MRATIRDLHELQSLLPASIEAYLRFRGWQVDDAGHPRAKLWYKEAGSQIFEALLPNTQTVRDYGLRVSEVLGALEDDEQRSQLEIVKDIVLVTADIIRVRRPTTSPGDAIPLIDGVRMVEHAMGLMTAAAISAISPRKVLPSRRPAQAQDYLEHVRLGQTERGSFVLTIVSDVRPLLTPGAPGLLEYMEEPFPRRVTRTLVHALTAAHSVVAQVERSGEFTNFDGAVEAGVSANFCESLSGLIDAARAQNGIALEVDWAPATPADEPAIHSLEFTPSHQEVLNTAAQKLRADAPQEGIPITGVVINLRREPSVENGIAIVSCVIDGSIRRLAVPLPPREYEVAIEAHRDKRGVYFKADVARNGRQYHASNVEGFRLID